MPPFDATAAAALDEQVIAPGFFAYLDIAGDPVRVTTFGADVTFSGTGDADLDGFTFSAVDPTVIAIGDVTNQEGGSDTLTCSLSGIVELDYGLLNTIAVRTNWQGRTARLWMKIYDEAGAAQGAIIPYYTGYMMALDIRPSPESQTIELQIENYLALLNAASNRTYLSQKEYDAGDLSAQATIGAANGARSGPAAGIGFGGGSSGTISDRFNVDLR